MEDQFIKIIVQEPSGEEKVIEAPTDMGLSLMEILKASDYEILATCGGMALCATCCVDILEGEEKLEEVGDDEFAMLDTLPDALPNSRLSCQLPITPEMDGLKLKIH